MPRLRLTLLAGVGLLAPGLLAAQLTVATERAVAGVVVDSVSGKTVRGAVLYFDAARVEHLSGRDGRFSIEHASIGDTLLVVRSIGYVPSFVVVPASTSASAVDIGQVVLRPVATRLDQIAVEAEAVRRFPHMEDFYVRKQTGRAGDFITTEDIEKIAARKTSEILNRSAKLQMDCQHDVVRSGDEGCVARDRRGLGYKVTSGDPSRCAKELFVDGRLSMQAVDDIPVDQIAGIEIYAGPATTPANFGQRRCGVIAIWTKATGRN